MIEKVYVNSGPLKRQLHLPGKDHFTEITQSMFCDRAQK